MPAPFASAAPAVAKSGPAILPPVPAAPEPAARQQAKAQKKARKRERLRAFLAWCTCCRFMSGSF